MPSLDLPPELRRNRESDPVAALDAAVWLIDHMCHHVGLDDLADAHVLDVGCGMRFAQAFVDRAVPIRQYVGVDTDRAVIDFLSSHVHDSRLEFVAIDTHNALYNPGGQPLAELSIPEIESLEFDLICLFSVFTHLAPHDYVAMLRLLRRFVKQGGRLFFTLFIDEVTEGGYGYRDRLNRAIEANPNDEQLLAAIEAGSVATEPPDFWDVEPERPLHVAMYSRRHALELIDGTGWKVLEVAPPDRRLQHHIVCAPI